MDYAGVNCERSIGSNTFLAVRERLPSSQDFGAMPATQLPYLRRASLPQQSTVNLSSYLDLRVFQTINQPLTISITLAIYIFLFLISYLSLGLSSSHLSSSELSDCCSLWQTVARHVIDAILHNHHRKLTTLSMYLKNHRIVVRLAVRGARAET